MATTMYENPTASGAKESAVDFAFEEIAMKESNDKAARPMVETTNYATHFKLMIFGFLVVIGVTVITLGLVANLDARMDDMQALVKSAPAAPPVEIHSVENHEIFMAGEAGEHITKLGENICHGKKPVAGFENFECIFNDTIQALEQAGGNVTKGYNGLRDVAGRVPITDSYYKVGLCPVNVHWHLGAEHLSEGEYDSHGSMPGHDGHRRLLAAGSEIRQGHLCHHYDATNPAFTHEYDWKHCVNTKVGMTYEVHWPHSAMGACATPNQYQTPFYDGVFCNIDLLDFPKIHHQVGVQSQVFTIINDEDYYYPDLVRGMIVDGVMGTDVAKYTGSTTGDSRNNEICSAYSPITWQVDRKCHLISASSFDKMCADMKAMRDDMSDDLYPHGSRETVADHLAASNHQTK